MRRRAAASLSLEDLAACRARIVPSLDIPYRGYAFQAARGLTAAPTLADVARPAVEQAASRKRPTPVYFEALVEALQQAYHDPPRRARRRRSRRRESCTTHITAIDRDGGIAALTTTLLSTFGSRYVLPQTGILMNNGVMWFDPRPGRPNSIGAGQARADQYVPGGRRARRPAVVRRRRVGRPAHPRRGGADGELYRRFRR